MASYLVAVMDRLAGVLHSNQGLLVRRLCPDIRKVNNITRTCFSDFKISTIIVFPILKKVHNMQPFYDVFALSRLFFWLFLLALCIYSK